MLQPARPGEDARHRVGARLVPLLVLAPVARDRPVRGLRLDGLPVGGDEDRGHEAERAVALEAGGWWSVGRLGAVRGSERAEISAK